MNSSVELTGPIVSIVGALIVAYVTAAYALRRQHFHGKARLLDICRRYMLNFVNAFDREGGRRIRQDVVSYRLYVAELRAIVEDLQALLGNAFLEKLLVKYPRTSKLLVLLRRELVEHTSGGEERLRGLNRGTLIEVLDLMEVLGRQVSLNSSDPFEREVLETVKALRQLGADTD